MAMKANVVHNRNNFHARPAQIRSIVIHGSVQSLLRPLCKLIIRKTRGGNQRPTILIFNFEININAIAVGLSIYRTKCLQIIID